MKKKICRKSNEHSKKRCIWVLNDTKDGGMLSRSYCVELIAVVLLLSNHKSHIVSSRLHFKVLLSFEKKGKYSQSHIIDRWAQKKIKQSTWITNKWTHWARIFSDYPSCFLSLFIWKLHRNENLECEIENKN